MSKKSWTVIAILVVSAPVIVIFILVAKDVISNSIAINHFEQNLAIISHPTNTHLIRKRKCVGLLVGNGNHCDYFVGELRTYSGSWDAVAQAYAGVTVENPIDQEPVPVIVSKASDAFRGDRRLPYGLETLEGWDAGPHSSPESLYLVYIFPSYAANLDPRCH